MQYPHLASLVFNQPLLIAPHKLDVILSVLADKLNLDVPELKAPMPVPAARTAEVLEGGVAVIPVVGTLVHRSLGLEAMSGITSYRQVADQFNAALADSAIREIVLDMDTPGGSANGVFDLSDIIFNSRGEKPITAIVNESAFSAGYAIASAADQIVVPRTGGVGSIGVIAKHTDYSKANENDGIKVTTIYAGDRKNDGNPDEPLSDEARATLQGIVAETYALFVDTVARNLGVATKTIRDTQAGIFIGKSAIKAGLANRIASAEDALSTVIERGSQTMTNETVTAGENKSVNKGVKTTKTVHPNGDTEYRFEDADEKVKETASLPSADAINFDERLKVAVEEAAAKAISAERERVSAINAMCNAKQRPDLADALIKAGHSPDKAKIELFDLLSAAELAIDSNHSGLDTHNDKESIAASWEYAIAKVKNQLRGN